MERTKPNVIAAALDQTDVLSHQRDHIDALPDFRDDLVW
jgi:hypothetical protein